MQANVREAAQAASELIRLRVGFTGYEMAELMELDEDFADWLVYVDNVQIEDQDEGTVVICDFADFDEMVAMFITMVRPVYFAEAESLDYCRCVMEAHDLAEITREALGYNNDTVDQEFAVYAVSCMLPSLGPEATSILWRELTRHGNINMTADLCYALTRVTQNPHIVDVVEQYMSVSLDSFVPTDELSGAADRYFGAGARATSFEEELMTAGLAT